MDMILAIGILAIGELEIIIIIMLYNLLMKAKPPSGNRG